MHAIRFVLAGAVALAVALPAFAQRVEIQVQPKAGAVQNVGPLLPPPALERLKFTDEQKERYNQVDADYRDKGKAILDAFRTSIANLKDREKYKEANEKMLKDWKKNRDDSLAKIEKTLTDDQKTVFAQVKNLIGGVGGPGFRPVLPGGPGIGQVLPMGLQQRLQLTDEQKKKIEEIQKEAEAKIMKVLTEEQKKQLENLKKGPTIRPLPNPRPIQIQPRVPNVRPVDPAKE